SLGGRLTVRLQTLDLRIGVRIPASQPIKSYKPKSFRHYASRSDSPGTGDHHHSIEAPKISEPVEGGVYETACAESSVLRAGNRRMAPKQRYSGVSTDADAAPNSSSDGT